MSTDTKTRGRHTGETCPCTGRCDSLFTPSSLSAAEEGAMGLPVGLRGTQEVLNSQDSPAKAIRGLALSEQRRGV